MRVRASPRSGRRDRSTYTKLDNASYICRTQSLGALLANKLHCFAFIQRFVTALLDGGEMYKHIFSAGALNESEAFGAIEPLHYALFLHVHSPLRVWAQLTALRAFPPRARGESPGDA